MLDKYNEIQTLIKETNVSLKKKLCYALFSILISLIIISGPLCLCINLMILRDFQKILGFAIATIIVLFSALVDYFYIKCIVKDTVKNIRYVVLTDTFALAIVVYLILIFIYFMGWI